MVGETTEETLPVFCDTAKQKHSKIYLAEKEKEIISSKALADGGIEYETISLGNIKGELGGIYQEKTPIPYSVLLKYWPKVALI